MTWPKQGTWDSGFAYELPTSEHPIAATASSSSPGVLLPTPNAEESTPTDEYVEEIRQAGIRPDERLYLEGRKWHAQRTLSRIAPALLPTPTGDDANNVKRESGSFQSLAREVSLLPTPMSSMGTGPGTQGRAGGENLQTTASKLLPTPTAALADGGQTSRSGGRKDERLLTGIAQDAARTLLPTPQAADALGGRVDRNPETLATGRRPSGSKASVPLATAVDKLLPTPMARDGSHGPSGASYRGEADDLPGAMARLSGTDNYTLLPTPVANPENPGAGGELRAALTHDDGRNRTGTDSLGRPNQGRPARADKALLPTPRAASARTSRRAMTGVRQWAAPTLEQAAEIAQGILPREFETWDEVPGWSQTMRPNGEPTGQPSGSGSAPSDDPPPGQLTIGGA